MMDFTKLTVVITLYGSMFENPIIMLCTLSLCSAICQFYLSNTRRKNKKKQKIKAIHKTPTCG